MRAASRRFVVMCCCLVYLVTLSVASLMRPAMVIQTNNQAVTVRDSREEIHREIALKAYEDLKDERSVRWSDADSGKPAGHSVSIDR